MRRLSFLAVMLFVVGACSPAAAPTSQASDSTPAPGMTGVPMATAPTAASEGPGVTPRPAGTAVSRWDAFKEQAKAFTSSASTLREVTDAWLAGDKAGALTKASELRKESLELVAWLDANQPDTCYAKSWEYLHKAAQLTASGALKLTQSDENGWRDDFATAGGALIDAGGSIMESGDACSA